MLLIRSFTLRKVVLQLVVVAGVISTLCYFTSIGIFYSLQVLPYQLSLNVPVGPLHVLLVAHARTGSSFTGELLQSLPSTFFFYEPLHFISKPVLNGSFHEARDVLNYLLNCDISKIDGFLDWHNTTRINRYTFKKSIRYWKECNKYNSCLDGTYIDTYCSNQTTRVAKIIRLSLLETSKLFISHPNLNLKLIYLTRDPRGTMNSRSKEVVSLWCKNDTMCSSLNDFCSGLRNDVEVACSLSMKRPNDFIVVRYEDLATDPFRVATQLTKFLGLTSVPESTREFIKTHTYLTESVKQLIEADSEQFPYTTVRNSSVTASRWRKELPYQAVTILQNTCKHYLSAFGYPFYQTESDLRSNADMNGDLDVAFESTCAYLNS